MNDVIAANQTLIVAIVSVVGTALIGPIVVRVLGRKSEAAAIQKTNIEAVALIITQLRTQNTHLGDYVADLEQRMAAQDALFASTTASHRVEVSELQALIAEQADHINDLQTALDLIRQEENRNT